MFLITGLCCLSDINGKKNRDPCRRKEYTPINGYYHNGKVITVPDYTPLWICVKSCHTYLECHNFNMKWINPSQTMDTCTLLQEVCITSPETGAVYDEKYTHYCKLFFIYHTLLRQIVFRVKQEQSKCILFKRTSNASW